MHFLPTLLLCFLLLLAPSMQVPSCYKKPFKEVTERVLSPQPKDTIHSSELPKAFDWRNVHGRNLVTGVRSQRLPSYCGSCWAVATTSALSDRLKIATKGSVPDILMSPQVLLNGGAEWGAGSCLGGSYELAYEFMHTYGITDESCSPYEGVDFTNWGESDWTERGCKDCDLSGNCYFVNGTVYYVEEYGSVLGEEEMMKEIYARGTIACAIYAHSDEFKNYHGGIIMDTTKYESITHIVSILGWGVGSDGTPYWVGRNSAGTRWGENGFFRLIRGEDALNIESTECYWATPTEESIENYGRVYFDEE